LPAHTLYFQAISTSILESFSSLFALFSLIAPVFLKFSSTRLILTVQFAFPTLTLHSITTLANLLKLENIGLFIQPS